MNIKIKFSLKTLSEVSLYRKFATAFIFMSLVPILLILFIVHQLKITPLLEEQLPYFRLTILLVVLLCLACFELIRRSMLALARFTQTAVEIANGAYGKRVDIDTKDELGHLARSFNEITSELEDKIKKLQESKKLLQYILNKVGMAVTSTKGIDNLLELIIQTIVQGIEAVSGAVFLIEKQEPILTMKVSFGETKIPKRIFIDDNNYLISKVARSKKIIAEKDMMAAPLMHNDNVLGVILVSSKISKGPFTADDAALLTNVSAQTAVAIENYQLNEDAEKTYLETITALAVAVEAKDPYSRGHLERVSDYVIKLASHLNLDEETKKTLKQGAVLHDVGKIGVRDEVLKKHGPLTEEESKEMQQHVIIGVNIIKPIRSMAALCDLVRYHQEWYDGSGYPDGLKGEEIPLTARIVKVCDAYDAMTTDRPYRKALTKEEARNELIKKSSIEFDPAIVNAFVKAI